MKKIICIALCLVTISICSFATDISARSAVVYDCYSKSVIYEKNADERLPIASLTKIMTGFIASGIYDLNSDITVQPQWCGIEGSSMYLAPGEKLKISELLYGLLLMSGNDAAVALASLYTGEVQDFVKLMNDKAASLGLANTSFANPSGLDDENNYSTSRELAILTSNALANPNFARICKTKQITTSGRYMNNHNRLLSTIQGAIGVKTGYTDEAGRCLVSAVTREGRTFIVVTLNAHDDWQDHEKLFEQAFYDIRQRLIINKGLIGYANIAGIGPVSLHISSDIKGALTTDEIDRLEVSLKGPRMVYGSIEEGERYGTLSLRLNGNVIIEEPVYFSETIKVETPKLSFKDRIKGLFQRG